MRLFSIFIVEDEPVIALNLQLELELAGHRVTIATNTGEAMKLCARQRPDVAIMNLLFENSMDGMALARILRIRYFVVVLFITGARIEDLEASKDFYAGYDVLYKPFTARQLREFLLKLEIEKR